MKDSSRHCDVWYEATRILSACTKWSSVLMTEGFLLHVVDLLAPVCPSLDESWTPQRNRNRVFSTFKCQNWQYSEFFERKRNHKIHWTKIKWPCLHNIPRVESRIWLEAELLDLIWNQLNITNIRRWFQLKSFCLWWRPVSLYKFVSSDEEIHAIWAHVIMNQPLVWKVRDQKKEASYKDIL